MSKMPKSHWFCVVYINNFTNNAGVNQVLQLLGRRMISGNNKYQITIIDTNTKKINHNLKFLSTNYYSEILADKKIKREIMDLLFLKKIQ